MKLCKLLDTASANMAPRDKSEAVPLIGKYVRYLCTRDIDRSGRGYIFPQSGYVDGSRGRALSIDGHLLSFRDIVELVVLPVVKRITRRR